jgi:orotate phosphoribosyltransferase
MLPPVVDHLAAPEGAATLLVAAVGLETGLPVAIVRKEPKAYGTRSQIEGHAPRGARVALIEDVSTTGRQVRTAAEVLERAGATVEVIVLAIDRGGADNLREAGYEVRAVASINPVD